MMLISFFTTRHGIVKRTSVKEFANIRQNGLKALNLKDEDELINVLLTEEEDGYYYWYQVWLCSSLTIPLFCDDKNLVPGL